jgi:mannose-6-phosphate isomerase-like protein (cupin superfamily)
MRKGIPVRRVILPLAFIFATVVAAALLLARASGRAGPIGQNSPDAFTSPIPLILQEGDGEHLVSRTGPTGGLPFTIKLDGQNGDTQDFLVLTETMGPGQTIPFHKHENSEEILILEEGGATVTVGDKQGVAGPRSIVYIPRNTWISVTNSGAQNVHLIAVFSRRGFERYLRAVSVKPGEPVTPVGEDDLPRLRSLGRSMFWDTSKGAYPPGVAHP